jgi:hypothetical protein
MLAFRFPSIASLGIRLVWLLKIYSFYFHNGFHISPLKVDQWVLGDHDVPLMIPFKKLGKTSSGAFS